MYTLRTVKNKKPNEITSIDEVSFNPPSHNQWLGEDYHIFYKNNSNEYKEVKERCIVNENTYAIIVAKSGSLVIPLFTTNEYYIMTESGKTFEKL